MQGTTGTPKGATLSHHNIINNSYYIGLRLGYHQMVNNFFHKGILEFLFKLHIIYINVYKYCTVTYISRALNFFHIFAVYLKMPKNIKNEQSYTVRNYQDQYITKFYTHFNTPLYIIIVFSNIVEQKCSDSFECFEFIC